MAWIDDFEGNRLSKKWVATRLSMGGQNDGVWTREVKNSKIYWIPTSSGTETGYFGEWLSLPVNAIGDIIVDMVARGRGTAGVPNGFIGVGVNQTALTRVRYGVQMNFPAAVTPAIYATNNAAFVYWPGFPSRFAQYYSTSDAIAKFRVVRKNGYLFLYINNIFAGQYAYAPAITTVDIYSTWQTGQLAEEHWVDYIKVTPESVVL